MLHIVALSPSAAWLVVFMCAGLPASVCFHDSSVFYENTLATTRSELDTLLSTLQRMQTNTRLDHKAETLQSWMNLQHDSAMSCTSKCTWAAGNYLEEHQPDILFHEPSHEEGSCSNSSKYLSIQSDWQPRVPMQQQFHLSFCKVYCRGGHLGLSLRLESPNPNSQAKPQTCNVPTFDHSSSILKASSRLVEVSRKCFQ